MPRFIDPSQRYSGGGIIDPSPRGNSTIGRAGALEALLSMFDENSADAMRLAQGGMDPATLAQILANRQGRDTQERMARQQGDQAYMAQLQQAIARGQQAQADRAIREQMQARQLGASERTAGQNLAAQQAQLKLQQEAARRKQDIAGQQWSADYQRRVQRDKMQQATEAQKLALEQQKIDLTGKPLGPKDRAIQINRALRSYEREATRITNDIMLDPEEKDAQLAQLMPAINSLRKQLLEIGVTEAAPSQDAQMDAAGQAPTAQTTETPASAAPAPGKELVAKAREIAWAALQNPNINAGKIARKNFPGELGQQFTWLMSELLKKIMQNG